MVCESAERVWPCRNGSVDTLYEPLEGAFGTEAEPRRFSKYVPVRNIQCLDKAGPVRGVT